MKLKLFFFGLAFLLAPLMAQTVTVANLSNSGLDDPDGADFVSGDNFLVTITGAASNQTVSVYQTNNGVPNTQGPWPMGSTNSSGSFSLTGSEADVNAEVEYTQQWYVGGVAVGPLLDFEVLYKPGGAVTLSYPLASPDCSSSSPYGILVDVRYQITNPGGAYVSTRTGIQMTPWEHAEFYAYSIRQSTFEGDVCPSGWSTCAADAANDGTFHDVPVGTCATYVFSPSDYGTFLQVLYIKIGSNKYQIRQNWWQTSSSSPNHGSITNNLDLSKSR